MGGQINVASELGKGSNFTFTADLAIACPQEVKASEMEGRKASSVTLSTLDLTTLDDAVNAAGRPRWPAIGRPGESRVDMDDPKPVDGTMEAALRILVVDDVKDDQFVAESLLEGSPHLLDFADDGSAAVEKFKTGAYDLILMDIQMPILDGYGAAREIRTWEIAHNRGPIPILAISVDGLREHRRASLEAGFFDHVQKPISKTNLLRVVARVAKCKACERRSECDGHRTASGQGLPCPTGTDVVPRVPLEALLTNS
jgi:CheY-like chemotaxis protein